MVHSVLTVPACRMAYNGESGMMNHVNTRAKSANDRQIQVSIIT